MKPRNEESYCSPYILAFQDTERGIDTESVSSRADKRHPVYVGVFVSVGIFLPGIFPLFNQAEQIF